MTFYDLKLSGYDFVLTEFDGRRSWRRIVGRDHNGIPITDWQEELLKKYE